MKFFIGTILYLCFFIPYQLEAGPLTVRCSGQSSWGGQEVNILIEIAMPEKNDRILSFLSPTSQDPNLPGDAMVGIGSIQINEQMGDAKYSRRHPFIVTRFPDDNNSLIGFYLIKQYVYVIRADLWKKDKPFIYFDSYNNDVIKGNCE